MLIYQAPSERFIDDVRENTISDIMTENYKVRLGKVIGHSELSKRLSGGWWYHASKI
jgi:hypothetical protein